jgi:hypothetical protein
MKLQIISDGTLTGSSIQDAATGEMVENLTGVKFSFMGNEAVMEVTIMRPAVKINGEFAPVYWDRPPLSEMVKKWEEDKAFLNKTSRPVDLVDIPPSLLDPMLNGRESSPA